MRKWLISVCVMGLIFLTACHADTTPPPQPTGQLTVLPPLLDVPTLCQYPTLPTGCEATAAAMLLCFYGEDVTPQTVAEWLCCEELYDDEAGQLWGPDPHQVFVGDPFSADGYGCYAAPLAQAVMRGSAMHTAQVIQGETLSSLYETYVAKGVPLLVWVTMEMRPPADGTTWRLRDGGTYTWIAGEHCMVLIGCDDKRYYFNDPRTGGVVGYEKTLCEDRFAALGHEAMIVNGETT